MERPSVQAPDTFYPGAVSHNTAAVKRPQGCNLSRILHFSCGERTSSDPAIRSAPVPTAEREKYGKTPHSLFIRDAVHLPGSAPPRFQLSRLCSPSSSWEKNRSSRKRKGMLPYSPG
ncbi:hypothetical protein CXU03_00680 [Akkermansia muciniphila]|nr:hypothetical protein CXU03_00680 [Akkermansia muciniphila]